MKRLAIEARAAIAVIADAISTQVAMVGAEPMGIVAQVAAVGPEAAGIPLNEPAVVSNTVAIGVKTACLRLNSLLI